MDILPPITTTITKAGHTRFGVISQGVVWYLTLDIIEVKVSFKCVIKGVYNTIKDSTKTPLVRCGDKCNFQYLTHKYCYAIIDT